MAISKQPLLRPWVESVARFGEIPLVRRLLAIVAMPLWPLVGLLTVRAALVRWIALIIVLLLSLSAAAVKNCADTSRAVADDMAGPDVLPREVPLGGRVRFDAHIRNAAKLTSHEGKSVVAYETRVYLVSESDDDDVGSDTHRQLVFREKEGPNLSLSQKGNTVEAQLHHWQPSFEFVTPRRAKKRDPGWQKKNYKGRFRHYEVYEKTLQSNQKVFVYGALFWSQPTTLIALEAGSPRELRRKDFQDAWRTNLIWEEDRQTVSKRYHSLASSHRGVLFALYFFGLVYWIAWIYLERWYWPEENEPSKSRSCADVFGSWLPLIAGGLVTGSCIALLFAPELEMLSPLQYGLVAIAFMWPIARLRRFASSGTAVTLAFGSLIVTTNLYLAPHLPWGTAGTGLLVTLLVLVAVFLPTQEGVLVKTAEHISRWRHGSDPIHERWRKAQGQEDRQIARVTTSQKGEADDWAPVQLLWPDGEVEEAEFKLPMATESEETTFQLSAPAFQEVPGPEGGEGYREATPGFRRTVVGEEADLVRERKRGSVGPVVVALIGVALSFVTTGILAQLAIMTIHRM